MSATGYKAVASLMSYIFIAIMAYILVRVIVLSLSEWNKRRSMKKHLQNRIIGTIQVLEPYSLYSRAFDITYRTIIGKSRTADVTLPIRSLAEKHAEIFLREGPRISAVLPEKHKVLVNGVDIGREDFSLKSGDTIKMGRLIIRVTFCDRTMINTEQESEDLDALDEGDLYTEYDEEEYETVERGNTQRLK